MLVNINTTKQSKKSIKDLKDLKDLKTSCIDLSTYN